MDKILSPLARTSRAARCFSTTTRNAAPGPSRKPRQADDFATSLDIREIDVYKFDDPSSLGWLRLEKIREVQELFRKLEVDRPILQGELLPSVTACHLTVSSSKTIQTTHIQAVDPYTIFNRSILPYIPNSAKISPDRPHRFFTAKGSRCDSEDESYRWT
jgi:small subunit ribosomal protein S35